MECSLKAFRHEGQFVDRFMGTGEGVIDGEDVVGVPCTERLFVDHASALTDDLRKLPS